jgi:GLPGLI family protein
MKNLKKLAFVALAIVSTQFYAQTKTGAVTYEMTMPDNEEMAAMGTNTIKISFDEKSSATQMDMMGGMISVKTISVDKNNTKDTRMLMDMMGKKYEVTGESEGFGNTDVASLKDAESVSYDKKATKEILGYKCYKASVTMKSGMVNTFYITEAIAVQSLPADKLKLTGFPLEVEVNSEKGKVLLVATVVDKAPTASCFTVPEGYKKVTQEELQQELGGM